ncbi:MAG: N-acetylglucosamine-6-phosphate deacetylase [Gorillibacterium sp.]|nr:N-acetylglucosamine-6-phosphate deacetylase [Gorillibacterium sp.]
MEKHIIEANDVRIINARIVTPQGVIENGSIRIRQGRIIEIVESGTPPIEDDSSAGGAPNQMDAAGGWVLPGFIDIHVHGGLGHEFMEATRVAFDTITRFHSEHGTTAMLATTVTASKQDLNRVIEQVSAYRTSPMPYAQLAGVHLEGPHIHPMWKGAQNEQYIIPPKLEWLEEWAAAYPGLIRIQTLAPEQEGAIHYIKGLVNHGVVAAAGHTSATYDQVETAVAAGLSHAVHTFNAMQGLHHREPGTLGAVLTDDRITAEIIADGHHVHVAGVKLLFKQKGADKVVLITDAISAAGFGDGHYLLGSLPVVVKAGVARLESDGALAGSTLTMIDAFRYAVNQAGASVPDASQMASGNPARVIGIDSMTGSIECGKQADVLLLDTELNLQQVWVKGAPMLSP